MSSLLTALPDAGPVESSDLLYIVQSSGTTEGKVTVANVLNNTLTVPVLSDFSWVSQGTRSATQLLTKVELHDDPESSSFGYLMTPLITSPWYATAYIVPQAIFSVNSWGISIMDSGGVVEQMVMQPEPAITLYIFRPPSTVIMKINYMITFPNWLRVYDDGTVRGYQLSNDGTNWTTVYTSSNTAYITPNQVGLYWSSQLTGLSGGNYSGFDLSWGSWTLNSTP